MKSALIANGPDSFVWWDWVSDHTHDIGVRTVEHVQLTVAAVAIGFVISALLALVALRFPRTYGPITTVGGILYTIPSLALFTFLIPYTGLGNVTAGIALISYTILILVRNILAGIDAVPTSVREAADGMGYTRLRRLWAIEVPLAMPTIIAGLRITSVTVIGLVTVGALVGSGGYGVFITDGLDRSFSTPIVVGGALSVVLAVIADFMFVGLGWLLTPWRRRAGAPS